jgi:hypothetical protein
MKVVRVVNGVAPAGAVAIGRGSVWGNPFIEGADGTREQILSKFYHYAQWRLEREPKWLEPLLGQNLACYCSPKPCHGDVILVLLTLQAIAEDPEVQESMSDPELDVLTDDIDALEGIGA